MTTLNTIIEEEKKEAKQKWEEIVTFCQKRKDGPSVLMHENFLDDTLTTAMQRAYEAGQREANAKWEREVEKEIRDVQAILVDIGSGAFSRDQMIHAENVIDRAIEIRNEANTILDTILSKIRS